MSVTIPISVVRDFTTTASISSVYQVLADVPQSVGHFPQVERLVALGDDKYRWEMERMGTQKYYFQVRYVTRYTRSDTEKWIRWTPVTEGNGSFSGCWDLREQDGKTHLHFENTGHLEIPLPRLAKRLIKPFVEHQFNTLLDGYIVNLQRTFSGLKDASW